MMQGSRWIPLFLLVAALCDAQDRGDLANQTLKQMGELTASDGTSADQFGSSVAVGGNTVVVGAPYAQIGSNQSEGAAYVFVRPAIGWKNMTQVAKLTPSDGTSLLSFGASVAINRNTIVVGDNNINGSNSAYVFVMPSGGWRDMTETAKLTGPEGYFGFSVGVSGNVIVVGAPSLAVNSANIAGAVFVFVKPKNGWVSTSNYTAELTASDPVYTADLGRSLAISGNTVVAGATGATVGSNQYQGAAYVFVKPASGWKSTIETAKLTASDGLANNYFGQAVAVNGSTIASTLTNSTGVAYVFVEPVGGWTSATQTAELTVESQCEMGVSVAVSSTQVLAGAPHCTGPAGLSYVYHKPATGWKSTSQFNAQLGALDGKSGDNFGTSVSLCDGVLVVGATKYPARLPGAAYVF